jgi:hypothetical protein
MQVSGPQPETPSGSAGSWLYMLELFDIGLVHIDL